MRTITVNFLSQVAGKAGLLYQQRRGSLHGRSDTHLIAQGFPRAKLLHILPDPRTYQGSKEAQFREFAFFSRQVECQQPYFVDGHENSPHQYSFTSI